MITTDTPAVSTEIEKCALNGRQKWNGEIKHYCSEYNSIHIISGVSKPRFEDWVLLHIG